MEKFECLSLTFALFMKTDIGMEKVQCLSLTFTPFMKTDI